MQNVIDEYHARRTALARDLLLPQVRAYSRSAALSVLGICGDAISDGSPIDRDLSAWLARVLQLIAEGDSIEDAAQIPGRQRDERRKATRAPPVAAASRSPLSSVRGFNIRK